MVISGPGTVELVFTPADGSTSQPERHLVYKFEGKSADGGVAMSMYNTDEVSDDDDIFIRPLGVIPRKHSHFRFHCTASEREGSPVDSLSFRAAC